MNIKKESRILVVCLMLIMSLAAVAIPTSAASPRIVYGVVSL